MDNHHQKTRVLYLVGGGHSGSTIVSFLLGTAEKVVNVGELKFYAEHQDPNDSIQYMKNRCSCGAQAQECPFWQDIDREFGPSARIFHYLTLLEWLNILRLILWPFPTCQKMPPRWDDVALIQTIATKVFEGHGEPAYILDSSKSLARLVHLSRSDELDIEVIFLVRDVRGYVDSYRRRHEGGFLKWALQWLVNNLLIFYYLKKERIDYYHLSYERFCQQPERVLKEMEAHFGITMPDDYVRAVQEEDFHVRAGNVIKNTISNFEEIRFDQRWKANLNQPQKRFLGTVFHFFNQWWVDGDEPAPED